jgi:membrane protein DedA with SNARE-associated domain
MSVIIGSHYVVVSYIADALKIKTCEAIRQEWGEKNNTMDLLISIFSDYGYLAVFVMLLLCGFGLPIPEDITLVAGGIIAGLGYADVHTMFAVCMAGVLIGDGIMFTLGHHFGQRILAFAPVRRLVTPQRFAQVQEKFVKYGNWVLFIARFLPGLRSPIFIVAGMSRRISIWRFILMDGLAASISVPVWVYLGDYGAYNRQWLLDMISRGQAGIYSLLGIGALIIIIIYIRHRRAKNM